MRLKAVTVEDGKYVYSREFEKTVEKIKRHPPRGWRFAFFTAPKVAKKMLSIAVPMLIQKLQNRPGAAKVKPSLSSIGKINPRRLYSSLPEDVRRDLENLNVAYYCLERHLKRLGLKADKKRMPWLAYALWYLNDHEVEVLDEDE